jgi:hypothetical protein
MWSAIIVGSAYQNLFYVEIGYFDIEPLNVSVNLPNYFLGDMKTLTASKQSQFSCIFFWTAVKLFNFKIRMSTNAFKIYASLTEWAAGGMEEKWINWGFDDDYE